MIVFYDDLQARSFEPFATTRPLCEMRAGALLIRERWEYLLARSSTGFISASHLDGFAEFDAPPFVRETIPTKHWVVNSRALPHLETDLGDAQVITVNGVVAAVCLSQPLAADALYDGGSSLAALVTDRMRAVSVRGVWLSAIWDVVATLVPLLREDIPTLAARLGAPARLPDESTTVVVRGGSPVFVEAGAEIEPHTLFDTSAGPVLIRARAVVQAFTRVVGPCFIGEDAIVSTDRIAASSIGRNCRVHGEVSTSVFIGYANKGHDGFLGHSILGRWVNLGAGTVTSNLKNSYGTVALWTPDGVRDTGQQFLGTMFGDHVKTGIGVRLTTGCVLGAGANVFDAMPPKAVAPFAWGSGAPYDVFTADKFLATAEKVMSRRMVSLTAAQRAWLLRVHAHTLPPSVWPR